MIERTAEVPVSMPEVRTQNQHPELPGASTGNSLRRILHEFGLPNNLDRLSSSSADRHRTTRELLYIVAREGSCIGVPSEARYATRALITMEAQYATDVSDTVFLIEAIHKARRLVTQMRPLFVQGTEVAVEKIMGHDKTKAARLLDIMLAEPGELDGWSPVIDWRALRELGYETSGTPFTTISDGIRYELPPSTEEATEDQKGIVVQGQSEPPFLVLQKGKQLFFGTHNSDIATMQRWAEWFDDFPVATRLRQDLTIIRNAIRIAPRNPARYWAQRKNKPSNTRTK